ncbi:mothers against decapentaplegic homolog 6-like [Diretmus argenteus]
MFRSKRSGLVRRLWRSRLVTESDVGRDGGRRGGEGGRDSRDSRDRNPAGKLPKHRPVTRGGDPAAAGPLGLGEGGYLTESAAEREEEEHPEDDRGAMCASEQHRGSRRGQEGAGSRTVTCCLFGEWDLRPRSPMGAQRTDGGGGGGPCQCGSRHAGLEEELRSLAYALLKRLKERPLDALWRTIETKGGIASECVMVPPGELRLAGHHITPQYLLCALYRWGDLQLSARLKALSHCQSFCAADSAKVCCNPYHYSRLCAPESPPPPYSPSRSDEHKPLDSTLSYTETVPPHYSTSPQTTPRDFTAKYFTGMKLQ